MMSVLSPCQYHLISFSHRFISISNHFHYVPLETQNLPFPSINPSLYLNLCTFLPFLLVLAPLPYNYVSRCCCAAADDELMNLGIVLERGPRVAE